MLVKSSFLLYKRKGKTVPLEVFQKIAADYKVGFGVMLAELDNKGVPNITISKWTSSDPNKMFEVSNSLKDEQAIFCFKSEFTSSKRRENIPPYLVFERLGAKIAVAMGGFLPYFKTSRSNDLSDGYHLANDTLQKLFKSVGPNSINSNLIDVIGDWLKDVLDGLCHKQDAMIVLLDQRGNIHMYGNAPAVNYSWGWISDGIAYAETAVPEMEKPEKAPVIIYREKAEGQQELFRKDTATKHIAASINDQMKQAAETIEKIVPVQETGNVWPLPGANTISSASIKRIKEMSKDQTKYYDGAGNQVPNPVLMKELMKNTPTFSQQCGISSIEDIASWSPESIAKVCEDPKAAASCITELLQTLFYKPIANETLEREREDRKIREVEVSLENGRAAA